MTTTNNDPVLHHPMTGETIRVLEATNEVFRMELTIAPRGEVAAAHIHPNQEQTFEVISGRLATRVDGIEKILGPGDTLVLPPGASHSQGNPFDEPVVAIETYRPGLHIHDFFEAFFTMGQKGMTDAKGMPSPLYAAALFTEYSDSIAAGRAIDRVLLGMLAPFARMFGHTRRVRELAAESARLAA